MPNRRAAGGWILLAASLTAAGFLVLSSSSTEAHLVDEPEIGVPGGGAAVVARLRSSGGFAPFGVRIVDGTHYVEVRFEAGEGCAALLHSGDPWPSPQPGCTGPDGLEGVVGSLGVDGAGRSIVGVEFPTARECYESLRPGDPWPADGGACSTG